MVSLFRILLCASFALSLANTQTKPKIDFTARTMNGESVTLAQYLEQGPVYLSFWATWCEPCKAELKVLSPLAEKFREKGLTVLAVNTDDTRTASRVKAYVRSQQFIFPVIMDTDGKLFRQFNGSAVPFSLLIGKDGTILQRRTGFLPGDERELEREFDKVTAESRTP